MDFDEVCEYCGARYFSFERNTMDRYTKCCFEGNAALRPLKALLDVLVGLFRDIQPHSREFLRNILKYNNPF